MNEEGVWILTVRDWPQLIKFLPEIVTLELVVTLVGWMEERMGGMLYAVKEPMVEQLELEKGKQSFSQTGLVQLVGVVELEEGSEELVGQVQYVVQLKI